MNKDWSFTSKVLPKYRADGKTEINYTVEEVAVPGFAKVIEGTRITNTLETVKINGEKKWDMKGYSEELMPESIKVLIKNGEATVDELTVTAGEDKSWKFESRDLPKYEADGKTEIEYTVDEEVPAGFDKVVTGTTITNTYKPGTTTVSGQKVWNLKGNNEDLLPESITVYIKDGESIVDTLTVKAGVSKDWSFTSKVLPKYRADGKTEINYTVEEVAVPGFAKVIEGTRITNTLETVKINGEKKWDMKGYSEELMPESIKVLIKNGEATVDELTVTAGEDKSWKFESRDLPKYEADGETEIEYTVDEEVPAGFDKVVTGTTITNTYKPGITTVSGQKVWNLKGNSEDLLPESITVYIKDGESIVDTLTVKAGVNKDWSFTSKVLPKYRADGKTEINYTVEEVAVPGFAKVIEGTRITNTLETVKINGEKKWDMKGYSEELMPESIKVLIKNGEATVDELTVTAGEDKSWKFESRDLPKYEADGKTEIEYTVDEEVPAGFDKVVTGTTITNTYKPGTTTVSGQKVWNLKGNSEDLLPESITVYIKDGESIVDTLTVKAGVNKDWSFTSKVLPKYRADGKTEINYTVEEVAVPGFAKVIEGTRITNTLETVKINGEKKWDMKGYSEELMPESIKVLIKNGEATVDELTVTAGEDKSWKFESRDLPKYEADGKTEIEYTVDEEVPAGFDKVVTGTTITNTYKPGTTTVSGQKVWNLKGNSEDLLPESITVYIKDGESIVDTLTVKAGVNKDWSFTSKVLPKYRADGKTEINYTVEEVAVPGFAKVIEGTRITNTLETVKINGEKKWDMKGYSEELMPESIKVLIKNGEATVDELTVTAGEDKSWKFESRDLPKYEADGETEIEYTVDEEVPAGFDKVVTGTTITNTYKPGTTTVSGQKVWNLKGNSEDLLPESITVYIKDGESIVDTLTVKAGVNKDWSFTSKVLPKYRADGKTEINYTVEEVAVPGFAKVIEGTRITNTLETVKINGEKKWDMKGYSEELMPESIKVLIKNGEATVDELTVTAGEDKSWKFESRDLPKYEADGKTEIEYTVDEEVPAGFDKVVTGTTITNTYKPGTTTVSGQKVWNLKGNSEDLLPESITVYIKDGESIVDTLTVKAGVNKDWSFTSKVLPKYRADGKTEINYTVEEVAVPGFAKVIEGTRITNTLETVKINGEKKWDMKGYSEELMPESIKVLIKNGEATVDELTVTAGEDKSWKFESRDLPKYEADGKTEIEYTVDEEVPAGFDKVVTGTTITNTYKPGTTTVSGQKVWNLKGNNEDLLPESITVYIKDGESIVDTLTVKAGVNKDWSFTSKVLPKYRADGN
ncbi:Cna B-type domain-containing protein [Clostridiales bacterium FE2011]|nr:Cna B-type domain-containing protein [Clostridiales bacterium FE2011]